MTTYPPPSEPYPYSYPGGTSTGGPATGRPPSGPARGPVPSGPPREGAAGPKVLTTLGVLGLVAALVGCIVGGVLLARFLSTSLDPLDDGSLVVARAAPGEPVTVDAPAGHLYEVGVVARDDEEPRVTGVVVTGPDGSEVRATPLLSTRTVSMDGESVFGVARFTTTAAGTYSVAVDGPSPSQAAALLEHGALTSAARDVIVGAVLVAFGVISGFVSLGLTIGGAVWWRSRRAAQRRWASMAGTAWVPGAQAPQPSQDPTHQYPPPGAYPPYR